MSQISYATFMLIVNPTKLCYTDNEKPRWRGTSPGSGVRATSPVYLYMAAYLRRLGQRVAFLFLKNLGTSFMPDYATIQSFIERWRSK